MKPSETRSQAIKHLSSRIWPWYWHLVLLIDPRWVVRLQYAGQWGRVMGWRWLIGPQSATTLHVMAYEIWIVPISSYEPYTHFITVCEFFECFKSETRQKSKSEIRQKSIKRMFLWNSWITPIDDCPTKFEFHAVFECHGALNKLKNALPQNLRAIENYDTFKRAFKTHLFTLHYFNWYTCIYLFIYVYATSMFIQCRQDNII